MLDLDDIYLYTPALPVNEDELGEMLNLGQQMIDFAQARKSCMCLTANQVGINKRLAIVMDDEKPRGYDIFINIELSDALTTYSSTSISVTEANDVIITSFSFPRHRVKLKAKPKVHVSAFSLLDNDRLELDVDGALAIGWQAMAMYLEGFNKDNLVSADYQTFRKQEKKIGRNERCPRCGQKMKRCTCDGDHGDLVRDVKMMAQSAKDRAAWNQ